MPGVIYAHLWYLSDETQNEPALTFTIVYKLLYLRFYLKSSHFLDTITWHEFFYFHAGFRAAFKLHWRRKFGTTACVAQSE